MRKVFASLVSLSDCDRRKCNEHLGCSGNIIQTNGQTDKQRETQKQTDRQTDRQTDEQTDRPTDSLFLTGIQGL